MELCRGLPLATRPSCRLARRPQRRIALAVVSHQKGDFTPEQLSFGLQKQLADSARAQKHGIAVHRNWMSGLPHSPSRTHTHAGAGRPGWAFPVPSADFTPDQLRAGIARQLRHSATAKAAALQAAAPAGSTVDAEAEADLKRRKLEARQFIAPWLDQQARRRSVQAQAQLRQRVALMSLDDEQRALRRLLAEAALASASGSSAGCEGEAAEVHAGTETAGPPAMAPAPAPPAPAPSMLAMEDGTLHFSFFPAPLQAVPAS